VYIYIYIDSFLVTNNHATSQNITPAETAENAVSLLLSILLFGP
jgi:hypothetical protein